MLKVAIAVFLVMSVAYEGLPELNLFVLIGLVIGLSGRIVYNISKNTITVKNSLVRVVYGLIIGVLMHFAIHDFEITTSPVYVASAAGFLSMEIINEIASALELGLKGYCRKWINNLLLKHDENRDNTVS